MTLFDFAAGIHIALIDGLLAADMLRTMRKDAEMAFFGTSPAGYAVPVIGLAALATAQLCCDAVLGQGFYTAHEWPKLIGASFAGLILWIYGNWLNPVIETSEIRDGMRIVHGERSEKHVLFHIPVQYWGLIVVGLGSFLAITGQ